MAVVLEDGLNNFDTVNDPDIAYQQSAALSESARAVKIHAKRRQIVAFN